MTDSEQKVLKRFRRFHQLNPHVMILFNRFTRELIGVGHSKCSAYMVMHRIRWQTRIETIGEPFKISNDLIPFYARLWMYTNAEHDGFFNIHDGRHVAGVTFEQLT